MKLAEVVAMLETVLAALKADQTGGEALELALLKAEAWKAAYEAAKGRADDVERSLNEANRKLDNIGGEVHSALRALENISDCDEVYHNDEDTGRDSAKLAMSGSLAQLRGEFLENLPAEFQPKPEPVTVAVETPAAGNGAQP